MTLAYVLREAATGGSVEAQLDLLLLHRLRLSDTCDDAQHQPMGSIEAYATAILGFLVQTMVTRHTLPYGGEGDKLGSHLLREP